MLCSCVNIEVAESALCLVHTFDVTLCKLRVGFKRVCINGAELNHTGNC